MRKIVSSFILILAGTLAALPACSQDLASIKKALEEKYALTTPTADKSDIVKAGDVLVLKKSGLVTVEANSKNLNQNKYVNGKIQPNLGASFRKKLRIVPGSDTALGNADREFVSGEKLWVTGIEVKESGVVFTLFTDAYKDTRYTAQLTFPFEKYQTPTVEKTLSLVGEVFEVQPGEDAKDQQPAQQKGPGGQAQPAAAVAPAVKSVAETAPPPLAPPPPPPADPKTIALGQTVDTVTTNFGQPDRIMKLAGTKQVYVYKDMKVTFVGGKVTDVQ